LFLVFFAIDLYVDFQARNDLVWFHSFLTLCELGFLFLLFVILDKYSRLIDGDWSMVFMVLGLVIILVPITGKVYGMYVKKVAATHVTIWSRREEFADARVIMWFPHHVAFYTGKKVIVLPTADVVQVEMERN